MKKENRIIKKLTAGPLLEDRAAILDIETSTRFWRTSSLLSATLITACADISSCLEITFRSEQESDEYEILLALSHALTDIDEIITFNGSSFDLPHLQKKYEAYRLEDPLSQKSHRDLYLEYSSLKRDLGLPSRTLSDYAARLGESIPCFPMDSDPTRTLGILTFDAILRFFRGEYEYRSAEADDDGTILYHLDVPQPFPCRFSFHDEIYHLIGEGSSVTLRVHLRDSKLRVYHTDVENYFYLPNEGYSIHRTMAQYVDRSRKEKAVRENCFHLVPYTDALIRDEKQIQKYLASAVAYLGYTS